MKRVYSIIIILLLMSSVSFGDVIGDTESLTPSDVNVFCKTRHIGRLLKTLNYVIYNLMDDEQRNQFLAEKNAFRDKTGVDYLDEESLKDFGIDTSRPVSFAMFDKDNQRDVMLVYLPVKDETGFLQKFIELSKKAAAGKSEVEFSPVKAVHKNITITQIKDDMFCAGINGYFVIGSTGEIVRRVIDTRDARNGSLILTPEYKDYISKDKNNYDLNAFITGKFLEQLSPTSQGGDDSYGSIVPENLILVQNGTGEETQNLDKDAFIKSVDYISAGMGLEGNKIQLNASVKLGSDNPYVDMVLGLIKTGVNGTTLNVQSADATIFFSLNYKYLDNLCKKDMPACLQYNQFKADLKKEGGIDFENEFLPYYTGAIDIFSVDSGASGGMGDIAVYLPMTDAKRIENLWKKVRKIVQAKYGKDKKFGEESIDGRRTFWYIDESQMRFFVTHDARGIYAGNSTGLIKTALRSETMEKTKNAGTLGRILNDKTFFLVNIKKNNFLRNLIMMRAQGTPGLGSGLSRVGEISLFCEKREKLISIDLDIEVKEGAKKGK